ncbi:hypothetical protein, partial [Xanthomonas oryzae]|uniref:hypothetical protein n=1 Tax=Xanthomonas oryzae TaxID=347 RepID=UPI003CCFE9FF
RDGAHRADRYAAAAQCGGAVGSVCPGQSRAHGRAGAGASRRQRADPIGHGRAARARDRFLQRGHVGRAVQGAAAGVPAAGARELGNDVSATDRRGRVHGVQGQRAAV